MAKRFTDTDKWQKPWFSDLAPLAKLFSIDACDRCDHAGILTANFSLMTFQLGTKIDAVRIEKWFGDKIFLIEKDKYLIPSFLDFQYGSKDNSFKAKASAIKRLTAMGLVNDAGEIKDLPNSSLTVHQELANSLGIGIGKGIGKGNINTSDFKISKSDIDALYKQYPRKEGKSKGIDKLLADLKTPQDIEDYKRAQLKYVQSCTQKKTEAKYIKLFSSFVNCWRDWLDDDAGTVALKKPDIVSEMKAKLDDYENRRAAL